MRWERPKCSYLDCGRSAAPEHQWCHAHVIRHAIIAKGGHVSLQEAREMVRQGARADDWMADENDWIAT